VALAEAYLKEHTVQADEAIVLNLPEQDRVAARVSLEEERWRNKRLVKTE